ncbi:MAG TPA: signal peptidase I [Planctomycetota bacterium]|nr:signal peptidase I [Planctomycetota bacterium]
MTRSTPKLVRRLAVALLVAVFAWVLARTFVGRVYPVGSSSMEPTIHGSPEQVFVRYDRGFRPQRYDLVVLRAPAPESAIVVKRVVGLPGELLLISGGDLLIEGRRLGLDVLRPPPIPVFDSRIASFSDAFLAPSVPFEARGSGWRLDARGKRGNLTFSRRATDDHLDAQNALVPGSQEVNDLRIDGVFELRGSGKLTLRITEEGDAFELELELVVDVLERASLLRHAGNAEATVLGQLTRPAGDRSANSCSVSFENVDNQLIAEIAGQFLVAGYEANTPLFGVVNEDDRHLQPRLNVGASDIEVVIEHLTVARDLYYTGDGSVGTGSPAALGPDGIFVLGDNSADSRDSRVFGPVRLDGLEGRATHVVWPLKAARRLGGLRTLVPPATR